MVLIIGRSNLDLGKKISEASGLKILNYTIGNFSNGEISFDIYCPEDIIGKNVYFVQTNITNTKSVNDYYVESLQVADACIRLGALSISIVYAHFPYSRSDKKDPTKYSIMSSVILEGLKNVGYSRIICIDLHSLQIEGMSKIPLLNISTVDYFSDYLKNNLIGNDVNNFVLISPDVGGYKRIKSYSEKLGLSCGVMDKKRDYSRNNTVLKNDLLFGDIENKHVILIDDIADTMGTIFSAIETLINHNISNITILVTHGIFSGKAIELINDCDKIKSVITSNTIDQQNNCLLCDKLTVIDVSKLICNSIFTFY